MFVVNDMVRLKHFRISLRSTRPQMVPVAGNSWDLSAPSCILPVMSIKITGNNKGVGSLWRSGSGSRAYDTNSQPILFPYPIPSESVDSPYSKKLVNSDLSSSRFASLSVIGLERHTGNVFEPEGLAEVEFADRVLSSKTRI